MSGGEPRRTWQRVWLASAGVVAGVACLARIHNAFVFPPLHDPDGAGHALNVFALRTGELPSPTAWSGIHPPLYHALGALLWSLAPASLPVHVGLRLLSAAAGFAGLAVVWSVLRRRLPEADAVALAAFAAGVPVFAIATSTLGNETTGALFIGLALARSMQTDRTERGDVRHALGTALCLALAMLSKATGVIAVAATAAAYAFHGRRRPGRALACAALVGGLPLALAAPFYLRVALAAGGAPLAFVSGGALSPDLALLMAKQPPGEHVLADYLSFPAATLLEPNYQAPGMARSIPGLLYASVWADAHELLAAPTSPGWRRAQAASAMLGLLPTGLAILGIVALARRRDPALIGPSLFGVTLLVAQLRYAWILPFYSALKASYLLPALLPACLALAAGLATLPAPARDVLRAILLGCSLFGTVLTWYACWQ